MLTLSGLDLELFYSGHWSEVRVLREADTFTALVLDPQWLRSLPTTLPTPVSLSN
jgi:hypothetical protein